jgi:hypothetical protein
MESKNVISALSNSALPHLLSFLSKVEGERNRTKDLKHKIEYEKLAKATFWNRTEIRIILFGETYAKNYDSIDYHRYKPVLEKAKQEIDQLIDDQVTSGELNEYVPEKQRPLLVYQDDVFDADGLMQTDKYYGFYEKEEKTGHCEVYKPYPFFQILRKRGYPISSNLIMALESGKYTAVSSLLQELPKLMEGFLEQGASELEGHHIREASPLKAPEGTPWKDIGFTLFSDGNVEIKIKSNIKTLTLEQLTQVMSGNKTRDLLLHILGLSGQFSREELEGGAIKNYKSYISALRKDLKNLFQIEDDPIDSIGHGSYVTKFSASHQSPSDSF